MTDDKKVPVYLSDINLSLNIIEGVYKIFSGSKAKEDIPLDFWTHPTKYTESKFNNLSEEESYELHLLAINLSQKAYELHRFLEKVWK